MRDQWYGDEKDLVKWSSLLLLARQHQADRILQIAYYNPSEFGDIELDGHNQQIPAEVLSHFRDIRNITGLCTRPCITVLRRPFEDRTNYLEAVMDFISQFRSDKCVVFLDPDTGLEPKGKPDRRHVLNEEAQAIWEVLPSGWVYVFYQHQTNRAGTPWEKRCQFAGALDVSCSEVRVASGPKLAPDVAFFYLVKCKNCRARVKAQAKRGRRSKHPAPDPSLG